MTVARDIGLPTTNSEAFDSIASHLSPHKAEAYKAVGVDLVQGRRDGVYVWDLAGRSYINLRSSGGVFNFGHHPQFAVEALTHALAEHDMGDWLLPSVRRARGAEALARLLPDPLRYSFFTASGAEAVEVACKLARSVTGRPGFVCAEHGYHGHVGFSLAMDDPPLSERFQPLTPGITRIPFGDFAAAEAAIGDDTAAVIMETIPATAGYLLPPEGWFATLRRLCDKRGVLLILDEVQAGLARTGTLWRSSDSTPHPISSSSAKASAPACTRLRRPASGLGWRRTSRSIRSSIPRATPDPSSGHAWSRPWSSATRTPRCSSTSARRGCGSRPASMKSSCSIPTDSPADADWG